MFFNRLFQNNDFETKLADILCFWKMLPCFAMVILCSCWLYEQLYMYNIEKQRHYSNCEGPLGQTSWHCGGC